MSEQSTLLACAHALIEVTPQLVRLMRRDLRIHSAGMFTEPQFRVMAYLFREGSQCLSTLAEYQGVSLPTMSKLIQGLESRGLVSRDRDPTDRRRVILALTIAGRAAYESLLRRTENHIVDWIRSLSYQEQVRVIETFTQLDELFMKVNLDTFYERDDPGL
ncbi:MAG: MarR family transcriptional regulator [Anaerolineae bacterium]|nr:MarR family transcriptional regulator [Anaerolineae bacterium]